MRILSNLKDKKKRKGKTGNKGNECRRRRRIDTENIVDEGCRNDRLGLEEDEDIVRLDSNDENNNDVSARQETNVSYICTY